MIGVITLKETLSAKVVMNQVHEKLETLINCREFSAMFHWLTTTDEESYHNKARGRRQKQTCRWLVEGDAFEKWLSETKKAFMWVRGMRKSKVSMSISVNFLKCSLSQLALAKQSLRKSPYLGCRGLVR